MPHVNQLNENRGQLGPRMPSDTSLGQMKRGHKRHHHSNRSFSPILSARPGHDIPLVPPIPQQYLASEQRHLLARSVKGSVSSGLTRLRTETDIPSSDITSPPTPKDSTSMEVLISPDRVQSSAGRMGCFANGEIPGRPQFYDYSEQFERDQYVEAKAKIDPSCSRLKNRFNVDQKAQKSRLESASVGIHRAASLGSAESMRSKVSARTRLPASTIAHHITRQQILKGIEPSSTIGDMDVSARSLRTKPDLSVTTDDDKSIGAHQYVAAETVKATLRPVSSQENQQDLLSQTESDCLESSTIDFAVRYSIPFAAGIGRETQNLVEMNGKTNLLASPGGHSTDDRMSELLAGYQHTEFKNDASYVPDSASVSYGIKGAGHNFENKSGDCQRSSEELSFKSATDLAHVQELSVRYPEAQSPATCKIAVAPDLAALVLPLGSSSSSIPPGSTVHLQRPVSETPISTNSSIPFHNKLPVSSQESNLANLKKVRAKSSPKLQQHSALGSASLSTLGVTPLQPLPVPARDSSASKEAQNLSGVGSFLMRQWPSRFSKGSKQLKGDEMLHVGKQEEHDYDPKPYTKDLTGVASLPPTGHCIKTPERALSKQSVVPEKKVASLVSLADSGASNVTVHRAPLVAHKHSFSSPPPIVRDPSSVYSPHDSSFMSRVRSSSAVVPMSAEGGNRDSHTTTHLDWHGRKSFNIAPASVSEPHLTFPGAQDSTTTDLRLSCYRYQSLQDHLPVLREESHEDSSLNTSASNLKHSRFRLPFVNLHGWTASTDEAIVLSRSSLGSHPYSTRGSSRVRSVNLPLLDFSRMNLIDKMNDELGLDYSPLFEDVLTKPLEPVAHDGSQQPTATPQQVRQPCTVSLTGSKEELVELEQPAEPTNAIDLVAAKDSPASQKVTAADIDSLRVPSFGAFTQNISRILLPLRQKSICDEQDDCDDEDVIMEHAMEDIREVGGPVQKRSSARLRPVPGSPNMVVVDDVVYDIFTKEKEGGASSRQGEQWADLGSGEAAFAAKNSANVTRTKTTPQPTLTTLKTPPPALFQKSLKNSCQGPLAVGETPLSSPRPVRSLASTPTVTTTCPWNFDKNYPWAAANPSVDISLPCPAVLRDSPGPRRSHLRNTLSNASTATSLSSASTATASPFGTTSHSNAQASQYAFSNFGRTGDQHHVAGERYPTSALTPPTAIFRDHSPAFETSDEEDSNAARKNKLRLRKRFSSTRNTSRGGRSKSNPPEPAPPESAQKAVSSTTNNPASDNQAPRKKRKTFRGKSGMKPLKFLRKKISFHFDFCWRQGCDFIRKLAGKEKRGADPDED